MFDRRLLAALTLLAIAAPALADPPPPGDRPLVSEPPEHPLVVPRSWDDTSDYPPGKKTYWLGIRYRGTVVPQFLMNLFVDGGRNVYSNSVGLELDVRHDRFSVIPNITYTDYSMGDTLFIEKGKDASNNANYTYVNSSMKALYAGVDFLWSARIHRMIDFEYGLGVGVGVLFGDLVNNWVYSDPNGAFTDASGRRYSGCVTAGPYGCNITDHANATVAKVGGYQEPSWFQGGSRPSFFARITLPIFGLRIHPTRDVELRPQIGVSLTEGFFFNMSGNYRLPVN